MAAIITNARVALALALILAPALDTLHAQSGTGVARRVAQAPDRRRVGGGQHVEPGFDDGGRTEQ